ncbi:NAD(P)/FAD-dependent oxidoreductase [Maribellus maritimus]|uniref:NAD(P)/FAD-dependent oxidoreductase n=1 Tax=Maribellus maritimus TaxID=2870838 RepID=UPI001EE9D67D|nr:FAD-dependent oxidoreductase [Maribellus maritimus]MCG6187353.1 FAD-binding oxidoreductase [Maribellus maritimus]
MSKVVVVGGGVIGLFTAWFLAKKGAEVTVIDKGDFSGGCSYGNAGLIVPSHVVPLASPGMLRKGVKNLFNSSSAVGFRFAPEKGLIRWYLKFVSVANERHVLNSIHILKELSLLSKDLFSEIKTSGELDFPLWKNGLLMLYQSGRTGADLREEAEIARDAGLKVDELSSTDILQLEPDAKPNVAGGFLYHSDNHLNPNVLMNVLKHTLQEKGVVFKPNCEVKKIEIESNKAVRIETENEDFDFDELVIAAGMWSRELLNQLHTKIDVQPGKGYSFVVNPSSPVHYPALLSDVNVAVTPLGNGAVRFGGGMEVGYKDYKINKRRVEKIIKSIGEFYPSEKQVEVMEKYIWQGHRPCSFDGLPYIGRVPKFQNIYVGTGHSMMGVTLGPVTGLLLSELISGERTSLDLKAFRIGR